MATTFRYYVQIAGAFFQDSTRGFQMQLSKLFARGSSFCTLASQRHSSKMFPIFRIYLRLFLFRFYLMLAQVRLIVTQTCTRVLDTLSRAQIGARGLGPKLVTAYRSVDLTPYVTERLAYLGDAVSTYGSGMGARFFTGLKVVKSFVSDNGRRLSDIGSKVKTGLVFPSSPDAVLTPYQRVLASIKKLSSYGSRCDFMGYWNKELVTPRSNFLMNLKPRIWIPRIDFSSLGSKFYSLGLVDPDCKVWFVDRAEQAARAAKGLSTPLSASLFEVHNRSKDVVNRGVSNLGRFHSFGISFPKIVLPSPVGYFRSVVVDPLQTVVTGAFSATFKIALLSLCAYLVYKYFIKPQERRNHVTPRVTRVVMDPATLMRTIPYHLLVLFTNAVAVLPKSREALTAQVSSSVLQYTRLVDTSDKNKHDILQDADRVDPSKNYLRMFNAANVWASKQTNHLVARDIVYAFRYPGSNESLRVNQAVYAMTMSPHLSAQYPNLLEINSEEDLLPYPPLWGVIGPDLVQRRMMYNFIIAQHANTIARLPVVQNFVDEYISLLDLYLSPQTIKEIEKIAADSGRRHYLADKPANPIDNTGPTGVYLASVLESQLLLFVTSVPYQDYSILDESKRSISSFRFRILSPLQRWIREKLFGQLFVQLPDGSFIFRDERTIWDLTK